MTVLTITQCTVPGRSPSSSGSNVTSLKLLLKGFLAAVPPAVVGDLLAAHQSRDGYRLAVRTRQRLRRPALVVLMPKLMLATAPNQHLHQPREHGQSLSQAI